MKEKFGWMPTEDQELLLRAALLDGDQCIDAWKIWRARVDIERLDGGSQRMLPLVLNNLSKYISEDQSVFKRMKSVSKKTWYKNNIILNEISKILKVFNSAGIGTLILKGVPLVLTYYPNLSTRPMGDFDILVPWEKFEKAGNLLFSMGWKLKIESAYPIFRDSFKVTKNSYGFIKDGFECDLHWSILKHTCYPGADNEFWKRSGKISILGEQSHILAPEDQLIHVLEHGAYWNIPPSIRWIADAFLVVKGEGNLDWDYLVSKIREKYLYPMIYGMFEYINESFCRIFPENFLGRLKEIKINPINRKLRNFSKVPKSEFIWLIKNYFRQFLNYQIFLKDYRKKDQNNIIFSFFSFLFFRWEVKNPILFPVIFLRRFYNKTLRYIKRKF